MKPLLLTLNMEYLLTAAAADLGCGVFPLGCSLLQHRAAMSEWQSSKNIQAINAGADVEKREPSCTVVVVVVQLLSHVQIFVTPWAVAGQVPLYMVLVWQKYWSGLPFPSPGDFPNPETELSYPELQVNYLPLNHQRSPLHCYWECKLIQPLWETVWRFT